MFGGAVNQDLADGKLTVGQAWQLGIQTTQAVDGNW